MKAGVLFLHSPLMDGQIWMEIADRLSLPFVIPDLRTDARTTAPAQQHIAAAVQAAHGLGCSTLHVVAHSGAGVLVAPVCDQLGGLVETAVYIDAMLPRPGCSRFDLIDWEGDTATTARLREHLDKGGLFPNWDGQVWGKLIKQEALRTRLRSTLQPLGTLYWDEVIGGSSSWEQLSSLYVHCTSTYRKYALLAVELGWDVHRCSGGHLAPIAVPAAVTRTLAAWMSASKTSLRPERARAGALPQKTLSSTRRASVRSDVGRRR